MNIDTVKHSFGGYSVTEQDGTVSCVPNNPDLRQYQEIQKWIQAGGIVEPEFSTSEIKNLLIEKIKVEAGKRIVSSYPEYRQRNLNGAVSLIQNKELLAIKAGSGNYTPTEDEMTSLRAAKTCKDFIDAIRTKSNELEASLDSMTEEQLNAFDPSKDSNWE